MIRGPPGRHPELAIAPPRMSVEGVRAAHPPISSGLEEKLGQAPGNLNSDGAPNLLSTARPLSQYLLGVQPTFGLRRRSDCGLALFAPVAKPHHGLLPRITTYLREGSAGAAMRLAGGNFGTHRLAWSSLARQGRLGHEAKPRYRIH